VREVYRAVENIEIAAIFDDIAGMLKLKKENIFKIRAYQKAARSIEELPVAAALLVAEDRLQEVPGVGEAISRKITELVTTGKLGYYEKLKAEFPEQTHSAQGQVSDGGGE
jgi:DNA polymerase (family 10)